MKTPAGLCAALVVAVPLASCHGKPRVLAPDYEVDFGCKVIPTVVPFERFMGARGFFWFDEEGARRRGGSSFYAMQIDSYDRGRRMLDVIGLREPPSFGGRVSYRLTITGPPPTGHDARLESAAEQFVRHTMECNVVSVHRYENSEESGVFFNTVFADEQRRIRALR